LGAFVLGAAARRVMLVHETTESPARHREVRFAATDLPRSPLGGPENGRTDVAFRRQSDCGDDIDFLSGLHNSVTMHSPVMKYRETATQRVPDRSSQTIASTDRISSISAAEGRRKSAPSRRSVWRVG
jgi:hypothetical protein